MWFLLGAGGGDQLMPTGVKMYVRMNEAFSPEALQLLRNEFMQAISLTADDFYFSGPLIVVPEDERGYMPVIDESSVWLDVNLWKSYYGPGYQRGNPELFVKCAEWLEERLRGSEIYYGHDVGHENVSLFDHAAREELLDLYRREPS
jgi:hypothetical protein